MKVKLFISILSCFLLASCIERVDLPYRNLSPTLVVDGGVSNAKPPYTLRLSYSGNFVSGNLITSNLAVNGARVTLFDDSGDSTQFLQNIYQPALYQTGIDYECKIGKSYALKIEMPDGKVFQSALQKMKEVAPIDSIYTDKTTDFIRFYVNTKDPAASTDYYKWGGVSISLKNTQSGTPGSTCSGSCWAYNSNASANILADTYINGRNIIGRLAFYSPITKAAPLSLQYVEIRQEAISKEAYTYWRQYQEQRTRTGSIFDPLPSTIVGNMVNVVDSKESALGFFNVVSVATKRIVADPAKITVSDVPNREVAPPLIEEFKSNADCQLTFPFYGCNQPTVWQVKFNDGSR
ncbi:MAG: DUF4249 domain-containing protein [Spirosomaceae bacterium]|nr:DUF4249 domain-containing protein [Spirosomataceae bacterium]